MEALDGPGGNLVRLDGGAALSMTVSTRTVTIHEQVMAVLDALLEPFSSGIGRRALAEVVLLGLVCGPLGVWVLLLHELRGQVHGPRDAARARAHCADRPAARARRGRRAARAALIALAARDERIGATWASPSRSPR